MSSDLLSSAAAAGLLAGWAVAVPVGPIAVYLVALTARSSWRAGAGGALGVAAADGLYALLAVLGGAGLADLLSAGARPLRWLSVAVLLLLAVHGARRAVRPDVQGAPIPDAALTPRRAFFRLLALTLANPSTVVPFAALVLGGTASAPASLFEQLLFATAVTVASGSWQLLLVTSGAALGRAVTGGAGARVTALGASVLLAALALGLLLRPVPAA